MTKYIRYQYGVTEIKHVHLRIFNKRHLIKAKFYVNNALSSGNHSFKFQINLRTQTIVTAAFVRLSQNVNIQL